METIQNTKESIEKVEEQILRLKYRQEVMQHFLAGGLIESSVDDINCHSNTAPTWAWDMCEYRIKKVIPTEASPVYAKGKLTGVIVKFIDINNGYMIECINGYDILCDYNNTWVNINDIDTWQILPDYQERTPNQTPAESPSELVEYFEIIKQRSGSTP